MRLKQAYTLVEVVVYLALFGVIFLVIVQFFFTINQTNRYTQDELEIFNTSVFVQAHIESSIFELRDIDIAETVLDDANGELYLTNGASFAEYYVNNQSLEINRDGRIRSLTPETVRVTQFLIEDIQSNSEIIGARVHVTLRSQADPSQQRQNTFTIFL